MINFARIVADLIDRITPAVDPSSNDKLAAAVKFAEDMADGFKNEPADHAYWIGKAHGVECAAILDRSDVQRMIADCSRTIDAMCERGLDFKEPTRHAGNLGRTAGMRLGLGILDGDD